MSGGARSNRRFFAAFLLVSVLVAAGLSYFASSHPDGLEFVAEETGFLDRAEDSPTAASPLADYATEGVDNAWASGAIAGVAGLALTLGLGGGLFWVLRRKGEDDAADADEDADGPVTAGSR